MHKYQRRCPEDHLHLWTALLSIQSRLRRQPTSPRLSRPPFIMQTAYLLFVGKAWLLRQSQSTPQTRRGAAESKLFGLCRKGSSKNRVRRTGCVITRFPRSHLRNKGARLHEPFLLNAVVSVISGRKTYADSTPRDESPKIEHFGKHYKNSGDSASAC